MQLGTIGVWASMDGLTAEAAAAFARRVEEWGYGALWVPESRGRNVLAHAAWLLASTRTLTIATGIANIYARDPQATASAQLALAEQSGGRFLLGLGVSHVPLVEGLRGHRYGKPVATMRAYLEAMQRATYAAPRPAEAPRTVIAWGDAATIRRRIDEHWAAGADHVCIQALNPDEATPGLPDDRLLAALAPTGQPGH